MCLDTNTMLSTTCISESFGRTRNGISAEIHRVCICPKDRMPQRAARRSTGSCTTLFSLLRRVELGDLNCRMTSRSRRHDMPWRPPGRRAGQLAQPTLLVAPDDPWFRRKGFRPERKVERSTYLHFRDVTKMRPFVPEAWPCRRDRGSPAREHELTLPDSAQRRPTSPGKASALRS